MYAEVQAMTLQIILKFIIKQNQQLLKIIAEKENLTYFELLKLIPSEDSLSKFVCNYSNSRREDKPTYSSESSLSSSSSSLVE